MWGGIEKILEHVTSYSTNAGKVWYLIVFVFRLIVVVTVGQSVYSDEQSAFRCSTKVIGCDNVCYDKFSKISHIRFWAFQLLAIIAPAVVFHFYTLNVRGRIAKVKAAGNGDDDNDQASDNYNTEDEMNRARAARIKKRLVRRRKSVANAKEKTISPSHMYSANNNVVNVTLTREIRTAYLINVFLRIVLEAISLYIAYQLFHFINYAEEPSYNPFGFILIRVPQVYLCEGANVEWACGQHLSLGKYPGYIPCWVSRPWEKTIFMCYMNMLSALCCILSSIEFFQLLARYASNSRRKKREKAAARRKISTRSEVPVFHSVDESSVTFKPRNGMISGRIDGRQENSYLSGKPPAMLSQPRPTKGDDHPTSKVSVLVPISRVTDHLKKARQKSKPKTKPRSVGIMLQGSDSEHSQGSLYHSSEYERSSDEEEDPSLNSVSVHSA